MPKIDLHRNHKTFLILCAVVLVSSGVGSYFIWKQCETLDVENDDLQNQVAISKGKLAKIDDLEEGVIILRDNLQEYVRILPSDNEVNEFYRKLSEFASATGVQITNVDPKIERKSARDTRSFEQASYSMKYDATYPQFLQFINRLENHERFVSIGDITVKAGKQEDLEDISSDHDIQHACSMTIVTYVYKGNDVGQGVQIAGYDRKRTQLAEQIQEARHDLHLEKFQLLTESVRRDPMVDPRVRLDAQASGGANAEQQRALIDKTMQELEECDALFDLMEKAGSVMRQMELRVEGLNLLASVQTSVDDAVARNLITDPNLKREFERRVVPELTRLKQLFGSEDRATEENREHLQMEKGLEQMRQAMEVHDYQAVVKAHDVTTSLVGSVSDPELVALQEQMDTLWLYATTALEFQKLEIKVSGLVTYPDEESVAIVNSVVYRQGEAVTDELFLVEIHEDRLIFDFRGVLLTYDL